MRPTGSRFFDYDNAMVSKEVPILGWVFALLAGTLPIALALLPPFTSEAIRQTVMLAFSGVCHQLPERSPHIAGVQLAVCDRCLGIYGALALSSFAYLAIRPWDRVVNRHAGILILSAVLVPGIDWIGGLVGLWKNTAAVRVTTGAVFGLVAGYFFTRAVVQIAQGRSKNRNASNDRAAPLDDAVVSP